MAETTFEEAKRCPKCDKPGNDRIQRPAPGIRGATVHSIYCENKLCPWYNTCWMVQVNKDGSIPPPKNHTAEDKIYVGFEDHDEIARAILAAAKADELAQREPGAEIRRPQ